VRIGLEETQKALEVWNSVELVRLVSFAPKPSEHPTQTAL